MTFVAGAKSWQATSSVRNAVAQKDAVAAIIVTQPVAPSAIDSLSITRVAVMGSASGPPMARATPMMKKLASASSWVNAAGRERCCSISSAND
jgi:hypothetical protein